MSEPILKPVTPDRVAKELRHICDMRDTGQLDADEYEYRFARMVGELRDRKVSGTRAEIMAVLEPLRGKGGVDATAWDRLVKGLGLG